MGRLWAVVASSAISTATVSTSCHTDAHCTDEHMLPLPRLKPYGHEFMGPPPSPLLFAASGYTLVASVLLYSSSLMCSSWVLWSGAVQRLA